MTMTSKQMGLERKNNTIVYDNTRLLWLCEHYHLLVFLSHSSLFMLFFLALSFGLSYMNRLNVVYPTANNQAWTACRPLIYTKYPTTYYIYHHQYQVRVFSIVLVPGKFGNSVTTDEHIIRSMIVLDVEYWQVGQGFKFIRSGSSPHTTQNQQHIFKRKYKSVLTSTTLEMTRLYAHRDLVLKIFRQNVSVPNFLLSIVLLITLPVMIINFFSR